MGLGPEAAPMGPWATGASTSPQPMVDGKASPPRATAETKCSADVRTGADAGERTAPERLSEVVPPPLSAPTSTAPPRRRARTGADRVAGDSPRRPVPDAARDREEGLSTARKSARVGRAGGEQRAACSARSAASALRAEELPWHLVTCSHIFRVNSDTDLLEKLWGWEKLLPKGGSVSWSDYKTYLEEYHCRNVDAVSSIATLAQTCLKSEEELVSEWKMQMKSESLPIRKSIVLSCLIHERVRSFIRTGCSFSHVSGAALLCIAKEADLTCQLLRRGADPVDDYLIDHGREIRMCALSLMNCTSDNSVAASAVMLGMAKEAELMCVWMSENNKPVDFSDDLIPDEIMDSRLVRYRTLNVMINILEESSSAAAGHKSDKEGPASRNGPGGDGNGITADGAANTTGGGISDVLNSHHKKKIEGGEKSKKRKLEKEDLLEKLGWETLLPLSGSVKWADYCSYLEEYYKRNVSEFVSGAPSNQNPEDSQIANNACTGAALAKSCLKMEEELLSEWKTRVERSMDDTSLVSTIIQSSLIKELALSICGAWGELFAPSDVAFVCFTKEADLMCELLKHGAEPFDDIIQQSSVIRMCALGLVNLKGLQSIYPAAAMLGMANEAKKMCDGIRREKKLVTFSLSEPDDLEECRLIRINALDVMTSKLQDTSFPCLKMWDDDAMACD